MDDEDKKLTEEVLREEDELPLPESPASANITVWIDGFRTQFTARNGRMATVVDRIEYLIKVAKEKGWKPTWDKEIPTTSHPVNPDAPICAVHQKPMVWKEGVSKTTGKPYAFWACGEKDGYGNFCNYKPGPIVNKTYGQVRPQE